MTLKQAAPAAEAAFVLGNDEDRAPEDARGEEGQDPDEVATIDYDGRTYQIPASLKGALMRQADYTRKTQELAQQRKAVEEAAAGHAKRGRLETLALARLHNLDVQLAPFTQIDLDGLRARDPARAQFLERQFDRLQQARAQAARIFHTLQQQRTFDQQRANARQVEAGRAKLHKDIEDWSPETAHRILQAGKAHGFSEDEVHSVTDPRMILVLNKARLFDERQQAQTQAKRLTAAHGVKPAVEVGAAAAATGDPSRMSTAEWMRWRAGQLRKRN